MYINVENSIRNQKHLSIHPEWWKKHEHDLEKSLCEKVKEWTKMLNRIKSYNDKTIHEISLIDDLQRCIDIVTKPNNKIEVAL